MPYFAPTSIAPLVIESANVVAQRNGTSAQALNVYNTYTDASNYERLSVNWTTTGSRLTLASEAAGTGAVRNWTVVTGGSMLFSMNGTLVLNLQNSGGFVQAIGYALSSQPSAAAADVFVTRPAAATWQFGQADAAAPVAQITQVQSVVTATSNTAGADWTFKASAGTGTGVGGKVLFQVAPAGSTGTTPNSYATALTIDSAKMVTYAGALSGAAPVTVAGTTYTVLATDYALIFTSGTTCTVTLPAAASFSGRHLRLKGTGGATVISASSNVVPRAGGGAGTAILALTAGSWSEMISDGTNWIVMAGA